MKRRVIKNQRSPAESGTSVSLNGENVRDRLIVVLVSTRNPLNIGAAARAMNNFGFQHLRVVNPYSSAFREAKSAVGALALLKRAEEFDTLPQAVADCSLVIGTTAGRARKLEHELKPLPEAAAAIVPQLRVGRVALLFGSEKRGLSNRDLDWCHWLVRIPTTEHCPSMNLGQAVAVCLYQLSLSGVSLTAAASQAKATSEELDRVTGDLFAVLQQCGYLETPLKSMADQKVRRLVRRLSLSQGDAHLLLGMIRQMQWKLTKSCY